MTSQAGYHGRGSQLNPNQCFVKNKRAGEKGNPVHGSIRFHWAFGFLCTMVFMLTHARADEQTGVCKQDINSVVNFETMGLSPCSSTEELPIERMNICIPHGHLDAENPSRDPSGPPTRSLANVQVMVVLAIFSGVVALVGWKLYKHRQRAFTEADINCVMASEPAVATRSNPTFEIPPRIH